MVRFTPNPWDYSVGEGEEGEEVRREIDRLRELFHAKIDDPLVAPVRHLDYHMWEAFLHNVPGTRSAVNMVRFGSTYIFTPTRKVVYPAPNTAPKKLEGGALVSCLQEVWKQVQKGRFLGPFSSSLRVTLDNLPLFFSPVFAVRKAILKDGKIRWRFILDGRLLNEFLIGSNIALVRIRTVVEFASKVQWCWKLDMSNGFFQGPVAPED